MTTVAQIFIIVVALEHVYFLWLEMFVWETHGKRAFRGALKEEMFKPTKTMAANQGLYNGFLAAGLFWSIFINDDIWAPKVAMFFLSCVVIAGCFGALTAGRKIFFIQAVPAMIAMLLVLF